MTTTLYTKYGKRALDVVLAVTALALLSPALAAVAVLVRLRLGRPVFFHQARPGRGGVPFSLVKFRTMLEMPDAEGQPSDEARLVPLGRFLRSTSLDEVPELWNVIEGDMSIVGPRPLLVKYLPLYSAEQSRRHDVRPGMTGWAQVNGRNALSWDQKFRLDVWYVDNVSLILDLRILLRTIASVLRREGISADAHATMREFTGNGN